MDGEGAKIFKIMSTLFMNGPKLRLLKVHQVLFCIHKWVLSVISKTYRVDSIEIEEIDASFFQV